MSWEHGPQSGSCEHSTESSESIKCGKLPEGYGRISLKRSTLLYKVLGQSIKYLSTVGVLTSQLLSKKLKFITKVPIQN